MNEATVLVTGGSGFLAAHTIVQLLAAGHTVRTTIRSPSREAEVRTMIGAAGVDAVDRLAFALADLTSDDGWDAAVAGVDYVLHMASPFPSENPSHEDELIVPARDGTLRVLRAARDASVKRVVLTSSFAAIGYGHRGSGPFGETVWTNVDAPVGAYIKSKTLAEKAAWNFVETSRGAMELAVINPAGIFGPALGADYSSSLSMVKGLLERQMPFLPDVTFGAVDVRDVAALHVQAMVDQRAIGQRIIAASAFTSMAEIAGILRDHLGEAAARVPSRPIPTWLLKALALFVKPLGELASSAGTRREPRLGKAYDLLGWTARSLTETVIDTAYSLRALPASTGPSANEGDFSTAQRWPQAVCHDFSVAAVRRCYPAVASRSSR